MTGFFSNKNFEAQFDQNFSNPEKLRTLEANPNISGSYKKKKLCTVAAKSKFAPNNAKVLI